MKKIRIAFRMIIERLALRLLKWAGTEIVTYPVHMELYRDEIRALCEEESKQTYHTDDVLGTGYFRARRVMSKMKKKYPFLSVRALWKAVDFISEEFDV